MSAIITPHGPTGRLIAAIRAGRVRPVVCPHLVEDFVGVRRPKSRRFLTINESDQAVELLARVAEHHDDPSEPRRSRELNDNNLLAVAIDGTAVTLVNGDKTAGLRTIDDDPPGAQACCKVYAPNAYNWLTDCKVRARAAGARLR